MLEKNLEFLNDADLKKLVEERQKIVVRIIDFVDSVDFIHKHGLMLRREEGSSHCLTERQLNGFGEFDIHGVFGISMMGGNRIDIRFKGIEVFKVYWQVSHDECEVVVFNESKGWQEAFVDAVQNAEKILAEMKQKEEQKQVELKNQRIDAERKRNERESLLKRAKDLGLK